MKILDICKQIVKKMPVVRVNEGLFACFFLLLGLKTACEDLFNSTQSSSLR